MKFWTSAEILRLREMNEAGISDKDIALSLGRRVNAVKRKRYDLGLPGSERPHWSPHDIEQAISLRKSGHTCRQIAEIMGRTNEGVTSLFRDLNRGKKRGSKYAVPVNPRPAPVKPESIPVFIKPEQVGSDQLRSATIMAIIRFAKSASIDIDQAAAFLLSGQPERQAA